MMQIPTKTFTVFCQKEVADILKVNRNTFATRLRRGLIPPPDFTSAGRRHYYTRQGIEQVRQALVKLEPEQR